MDYKKKLKRYIYERDGHCCRFCEKELLLKQASMDHYFPKSKGGPSSFYNVVLSCKRCNKYKRDQIPNDYEQIIIKNIKTGYKQHKIDKSRIKGQDDLDKIMSGIERIIKLGETMVLESGHNRIYIKKESIIKIIVVGREKEETVI